MWEKKVIIIYYRIRTSTLHIFTLIGLCANRKSNYRCLIFEMLEPFTKNVTPILTIFNCPRLATHFAKKYELLRHTNFKVTVSSLRRMQGGFCPTVGLKRSYLKKSSHIYLSNIFIYLNWYRLGTKCILRKQDEPLNIWT